MWKNNIIEDKGIFGARNFSEVLTWIGASYVVHNTMGTHTLGAVSMGYGIIHGKSSKQNINFKISTEAEPVEEVN